jgi:hypothetical protein
MTWQAETPDGPAVPDLFPSSRPPWSLKLPTPESYSFGAGRALSKGDIPQIKSADDSEAKQILEPCTDPKSRESSPQLLLPVQCFELCILS